MRKILECIFAMMILVMSFLLLFYFAQYIVDEKTAAIKRNRGVTEAEVINTSYFKGYRVDFVYHINGIAHEERAGVPSRGYIGEYYKVEYDTTKLSRVLLLTPEIFFKPEQETAFTNGVASRVNTSGGRYPDVRFHYTVNGREYEREQNFYDVSAFKEGGVYPVEYLISEPRKGILRLPQ